MPWMRRFAEIWNSSPCHLAVARGWLALAFALIADPKGFAHLLHSKPLQKQMRWMLRLTEALLRLAITRRARAINAPQPLRARRPLRHRASAPLGPMQAPAFVRFRLDAPDDRWAIRPPSGPSQHRKPHAPIALLNRLLACQDGLDRIDMLARREARRRCRQRGSAGAWPPPRQSSCAGSPGRGRELGGVKAPPLEPLSDPGRRWRGAIASEQAPARSSSASNREEFQRFRASNPDQTEFV